MELTPVGIDIAKNVIQVHYVDLETGEIIKKRLNVGDSLSTLRTGVPLFNWDGSVWRRAALGSSAYSDGTSSGADAREICEGL